MYQGQPYQNQPGVQYPQGPASQTPSGPIPQVQPGPVPQTPSGSYPNPQGPQMQPGSYPQSPQGPGQQMPQNPQEQRWQGQQGATPQMQQGPGGYMQPGQQMSAGVPQQAGPTIHHFVTTAFELPGFRVVRNLGIVRGIIVRSRSVIGNIGASFQQLFGGNISIYTELCEQTRRDAYELMIHHAVETGANGIIGVRYDGTELAPGVTEVLCYGTAVTIIPVEQQK